MSVDYRSKYWFLWQRKIDEINRILEDLKQLGEEIHDNENFDWVIESINYSQASDKLVVRFKEANEK